MKHAADSSSSSKIQLCVDLATNCPFLYSQQCVRLMNDAIVLEHPLHAA
jgi:hypothetical protein